MSERVGAVSEEFVVAVSGAWSRPRIILGKQNRSVAFAACSAVASSAQLVLELELVQLLLLLLLLLLLVPP